MFVNLLHCCRAIHGTARESGSLRFAADYVRHDVEIRDWTINHNYWGFRLRLAVQYPPNRDYAGCESILSASVINGYVIDIHKLN